MAEQYVKLLTTHFLCTMYLLCEGKEYVGLQKGIEYNFKQFFKKMNTIFLAKDILNKGKTTAGLLYVKD